MKRSIALAAVFAAAPLVVANAPADDGTGAIIIYRGGSIMGAAVACPVRYKGREIVELARGKKAKFVVPPGRYILNNKTSSIEVSVDAGETRYVRCMVKSGFLSGRADLQIVDEESYLPIRDTLEPVAPAEPLEVNQ
jgi:hypothetical protein